MTPYAVKMFLIHLRKMEKEMKEENFLLIWGQRGSVLWEEFRSFDYSMALLMSCLGESDQEKLAIYVANKFQK